LEERTELKGRNVCHPFSLLFLTGINNHEKKPIPDVGHNFFPVLFLLEKNILLDYQRRQ